MPAKTRLHIVKPSADRFVLLADAAGKAELVGLEAATPTAALIEAAKRVGGYIHLGRLCKSAYGVSPHAKAFLASDFSNSTALWQTLAVSPSLGPAPTVNDSLHRCVTLRRRGRPKRESTTAPPSAPSST